MSVPSKNQLQTQLEELQTKLAKAEQESLRYQAKLYHAWRIIQAQQKGMKRMARKLNARPVRGHKPRPGLLPVQGRVVAA